MEVSDVMGMTGGQERSQQSSEGAATDGPLSGFLSEDRLVRARPAAAEIGGGTVQPGELRVWLTGTGTPLVLPDRTGPSTLLASGDDTLLVDAGNGSVYQLARLGFDHNDLTYVFITHHHADHNADLAYLLLSAWIADRDSHVAPRVIGPPGTLTFVDRLLALHEYDIRVRLHHGYEPERLAPEVIEIQDGMEFAGDTWKVTAFKVDHGPVCEAFGYRFDTQDQSIVVSGDTTPCPNLVAHAQDVDVLVHEALYPGYGYPDYHTSSHDVGKVAAKANAKRLVLTHLIPGHLPDESWLEHVRPHYEGPVTVGTDLLRVM